MREISVQSLADSLVEYGDNVTSVRIAHSTDLMPTACNIVAAIRLWVSLKFPDRECPKYPDWDTIHEQNWADGQWELRILDKEILS